MRTTGKINNNNSLLYINKNFAQLSKVTSQVAMQQQVIELRDDPLSANIGIKMLNIIAKSEQYNRNIKTGLGMARFTDGYLGSAKSTVESIRSLLVNGAQSATNGETSYGAMAQELNNKLQSLLAAGNANDGTRYIFGGTHTTTPPFTIVNGRYVHYTGNDENINILVDHNTTMPVNSTGSDVFGNMTTTIKSKDMNPRVNLATDHSTPLSDLNGGQGVPKGKITIKYSAYPDGLEVDLAECDTLEDVKDKIEQATLAASRNLNPAENPWLNGENLDWHDLQDRYVKVTMNPDGNGISLQERDLGEPLPAPTDAEKKRGLRYSTNDDGTPRYPGYEAGGIGIAAQGAPKADGSYTVHDKRDYVNHPQGNANTDPLVVDDYALNKVAAGLGIKGKGGANGFLDGRDLNPALSENTLLSDLEGYNDGSYTITNGGKPGGIVVKETSQDSSNVFSDWKLSGAGKGDNTGSEGELYARAVNVGTTDEPLIRIEIYSKPFDPEPRASDLVATGSYDKKSGGGTVLLEEANNSGLSGSVGVVLPLSVDKAQVNLRVDFEDSLQSTVHVPAFEEEQYADGRSKDQLNIASGWDIKGLDKPPAAGYDENHPVSTDLDGNISVNYRYDEESNSMIVELSRPASGGTPAAVIARGSISLGGADNTPPLSKTVSGRVELVGTPGFEQVSGSVYLELPQGLEFTDGDGSAGNGKDNPTQSTFRLTEGAPAGTVVLGGATRFDENLAVDPNSTMILKQDTVFKKGQVFLNDVVLPGGGYIRKNTPLASDTVIPKGAEVQAESIDAGTVLAAGQEVVVTEGLPAGTMIPQGSYYLEPGDASFPTGGMGMVVNRYNPYTGETERTPADAAATAGYNIKATFATVEDLKRAIEEAGVYVEVGVSDDGRSLEFSSSLAGAWLTVSEDIDGYEQMGDDRQQLSGLNLNGLVKGANSDSDGNVYTEVVYYPPDPVRPDDPVRLVSEDGKVTEIQPGYYVRVYSDPDQMTKKFEDRDNSTMVAEGFVPAGKWNPDFDADAAAAAKAAGEPYDVPAFLPQNGGGEGETGLFKNGFMNDLILEERNDSGVWGTVNLDYHGDRPDFEAVANGKNGDGTPRYALDYSNSDNSAITVYPGGLRPAGAHSVVMQEWDVTPMRPGVNCDYSGTFHGKVTADENSAAGVSIELYKDSSRKTMSAKSDPEEPIGADGKVTLYEVDRNGKFALDAEGGRIVAGSVALPLGAGGLEGGATENFELKTGGLRNGGQQREDNLFSTINDIMDAITQKDDEALHNLLGDIKADEDRILGAIGDSGARDVRMTMLSERHADDVLNFTATLTSRVGMDDQALSRAVMDYQASTNAYQAAMQVSSKIMQMSLLQYI